MIYYVQKFSNVKTLLTSKIFMDFRLRVIALLVSEHWENSEWQEDIMGYRVLLMNLCFFNFKSRFIYVNHLEIVHTCVKYIIHSIYRQA